MKRIQTTTAFLVVALAAAGCSGSAGGTQQPPSPDRDGDGVPNAQDAFPDDPGRFASYVTVLLDRLAGGLFGAAVAVNGSNEVVGLSEDAGGDVKAVRWTVTSAGASAPAQLDPLGVGSYSAAYGIGEDGVVVGESAKGTAIVAVAWLAGSTTPVELSLGAFGAPAAAYGISGSRIVGEALAAGMGIAVLWSGAGVDPVALGTLGAGSSAAYAIGETGLVVGEGPDASGASRGILWKLDGAGVPGPPVALPPLAGHVASVALGVNAAGEIVGESEAASGETHGVLWRLDEAGAPGAPVDLGVASASAVNAASRVAGSRASPHQAAAWDVRNTALVDPVLTGTFGVSQAYGLNDSNLVVGRADDRGFVAVPR